MIGRPYEGGRYKAVYLPHWYYLGNESVEGDGTPQALTLPDTTQIVEIRAEGGLVRFVPNGTASAASGGYIPEDGAEIIGPLANLNSVSVLMEAGVTARVLYFRENALQE
jgi:hypothetical protein